MIGISRSKALLTVVFLLASGASFAQSDVYMSNWEPKSATMQCVADPEVNNIPSVDPIDGSCMDANLRLRFEKEFARIGGWMQTGGLDSPRLLRPVVPTGSASSLLLYVDPSRTDYASYSSPCPGGVQAPLLGGIITFNEEKEKLSKPGIPSGVLTHEMAHAVQFGSGFADHDPRFCLGTAGTYILNWIREGTADALAWEYVRIFLPNEWKLLINRGSKQRKRASSLRPYDFPLQFLEATSTDPDSQLYTKHQNYASSYWRHLAWRYHGGNIFFIKQFFDTPNNVPYDWTRWANDILKKEPATKHGFYTTYPTFIADWASMNTTDKFKSAGISSESWRKSMFAGCPRFNIKKGQSAIGINFELKQMSATCIKVTITDLKDGEIGTLRIFGYSRGSASVEELHLSEIERFSADNRRCSEILDKIVASGKKPVPGNDCVASRTIPTGVDRAEFSPQPVYGSGGDDTVIFALSRVKRDPRDADVHRGDQPEKFRLHVSVDNSVVSLGGERKPAQPSFYDSRVWASTNLPIDITHRTLAAQEGKMRGPVAGVGGFQLPVKMEQFTGLNPTGQGAWSVSLETFDITTEQSPYGVSRGYEPREEITFSLKESTVFAAGQSYEAFASFRQKSTKPSGSLLGTLTGAIMGAGTSPPVGRRDFEPTILTVVERTEDRLTFDFNGRLCMGAGLMAGSRRSAAKCLSIEPLSGTFSIAYPDLYSMDGLLKYDMASEGNRIYRDQLAAWFNRTMSQAFGAGVPGLPGSGGSAQPGSGATTGSSGAQPGASGGGTVMEPCNCSCEAFEELQNQAKSANPMSVAPNLRCILKCAREYGACQKK